MYVLSFLRMLFFFITVPGAITKSLEASKPHIIFMLADDQGWNNQGFNNPDLIMPNINDAAVKKGVILEHHYVYKFCSPTRSSILSGRLPIHVNQENSATTQHLAGIPLNMTIFPVKLKQVGYKTHQVGKWHVGQATYGHIPVGRGFDSGLSFFNFGEDHYTQIRGGNAAEINSSYPCSGVDLWLNDSPAFGLNGTYGGFTFTKRAVDIITAHDPSEPLFMYIAFQNMHPPLEVPKEYTERYPKKLQKTINGMATFLDESVGNITKALVKRGMWESTLLVYSPDNGGYHGQGGDDTPLRGGKFSDFQGGTRVASFISGGLIPKELRGTNNSGYIHICDWYATFCHLAGVDPEDARAKAAGLPPIDSLNVLDLIMGKNMTSPRTEIALSALPGYNLPAALSTSYRDPMYFVGGEGLIIDNYKLVTGWQHIGPFGKPTNVTCVSQKGPWGPPNSGVTCTCLDGCLYDILADPSELHDLSKSHPRVLSKLQSRLYEIRKSVYAPDRGKTDQAACDQIGTNKGYWGPWLPINHTHAS